MTSYDTPGREATGDTALTRCDRCDVAANSIWTQPASDDPRGYTVTCAECHDLASRDTGREATR